MPETLRGLYNQRLRWAQGGAEVILRYAAKLNTWKSRRMWVIYVEYSVSIIWSYAIIITMFLWGLGSFVALPEKLMIPTLLPSWQGVLLGSTCLMQFVVSLLIDSRYEKNILKYYFWIIWYPVAYWMINAIVTSIGFIKAILKKKGGKAIWVSPDRGVTDKKIEQIINPTIKED
jgi:biofilm PGA synthesis N-glycosyltransferase PgaC